MAQSPVAGKSVGAPGQLPDSLTSTPSSGPLESAVL